MAFGIDPTALALTPSQIITDLARKRQEALEKRRMSQQERQFTQQLEQQESLAMQRLEAARSQQAISEAGALERATLGESEAYRRAELGQAGALERAELTETGREARAKTLGREKEQKHIDTLQTQGWQFTEQQTGGRNEVRDEATGYYRHKPYVPKAEEETWHTDLEGKQYKVRYDASKEKWVRVPEEPTKPTTQDDKDASFLEVVNTQISQGNITEEENIDDLVREWKPRLARPEIKKRISQVRAQLKWDRIAEEAKKGNKNAKAKIWQRQNRARSYLAREGIDSSDATADAFLLKNPDFE